MKAKNRKWTYKENINKIEVFFSKNDFGIDPKKRQPDISLAMENLNWEPKIELDDGLERTIKYFLEIIKN